MTIPWPLPAFADLSDEVLNALRTERKLLGRSVRKKEKAAHIEKAYELTAEDEPERTYSLFTRQALAGSHVFSCGLLLTLPGRRLMLCRYNGAYHPHRNALGGRERIRASGHCHIARAAYLARGLDGDSYAEARSDFRTLEGALHCLVRECTILGIDTEPEQPDFFGNADR